MRRLLPLLSLAAACGPFGSFIPSPDAATSAGSPQVQAAPELPPPPPSPLPPPLAPRFGVTHLLLSHIDAARPKPGVTRTRDQALELAGSLRERALAGEDLGELARTYSDDASKGRGGRLGTFAVGVLHPSFEEALATVPPGGITGVIETPEGLHIARREPILEARLVVAALGGDPRGEAPDPTESEHALRSALTRPDKVEDLAPGPHRLHDLGVVGPGQLPPDVEALAFALEPGGVSAPFAAADGWYLIGRLPDQRSQ